MSLLFIPDSETQYRFIFQGGDRGQYQQDTGHRLDWIKEFSAVVSTHVQGAKEPHLYSLNSDA